LWNWLRLTALLPSNRGLKVSQFTLIFIIPVSIFVIARPLAFFGEGDALIYFKGAKQLIDGTHLYEIGREPFGSRFFNGPLFGMLHIPFLLIPSDYQLVLYRIVLLIATVLLFRLIYREFGGNGTHWMIPLCVFLLTFPSRMNSNLAQGASFAFLSCLVGLILLVRWQKSRSKAELLCSSTLIVIALNYKPLLLLALFLYLISVRQIQLILVTCVIVALTQALFTIIGFKASYLSWFRLLVERSSRISEQGSSDIVGQWASLGKVVNFSPTLTLIIPSILILPIALLIFKNRQEFDMKTSIFFLAIGSSFGPYSPAQDSLMLTSVVVSILFSSNLSSISKPNIFLVIITFAMGFLFVATRNSLINSLLISFLGIFLISTRMNVKRQESIGIILGTLICLLAVLQWENSHVVYDMVGVGLLMLSCVLYFKLFQRVVLNEKL